MVVMCRDCGESLDPDSRFCGACGTMVLATDERPTASMSVAAVTDEIAVPSPTGVRFDAAGPPSGRPVPGIAPPSGSSGPGPSSGGSSATAWAPPSPSAPPHTVPSPPGRAPMYPPPAPPPYYGYAYSAPGSVPGATAALVLGILGIVLLPLVLSIPAIVIGRRAQDRARMIPGQPGVGAAKAGYICGIVGTAWGICWIVFWLIVVLVAAGA